MTYGAPSGPSTIARRSIGSAPSAGVNVKSVVEVDRHDAVQPVEPGHGLLAQRREDGRAHVGALGDVELLVRLGEERLGLLRVVVDEVDTRAP